MPEGIEDEAMAAILFAEGFAQRYGPCHPMFFPGSLDDAMKEACHQPARDVYTMNKPIYFLIVLNTSFSKNLTEKATCRILASRWFRLKQRVLHPSPLLRIYRIFPHGQLYYLGLGSDSYL